MCAVKVNEQAAEFLKEHVKGRTEKELAELVNKQFNKNITTATIKYYKNKLGLKKEEANDYNTKGRSAAPIGAERFWDGYWYVKIKHPNVWRCKHILLWENANGQIPKGHRLIFLDNDKNNICLENLALVNRTEQNIFNGMRLQTDNKELTTAGLAIAKLKAAIKNKKQKRG